MGDEPYEMRALNILLADDDKDDCIFFNEVLEELPLNTNLTTVFDGEQLMHLLQKSSSPLPDVLFLDLNMPRKNGHACLVEIKRSENLKALPVVVYSTSFDEDMADQLYENGAHHYICKPGDFALLKQVIHKAIVLTVGELHSQPPRVNFLLSQLKTLLW